jgi:uncharacterized protein with NRDE domain
MCVAFLAWHTHPEYSLIIASNRDEYLARCVVLRLPVIRPIRANDVGDVDRPAQPAHFWPDSQQIFAGRDTEAGGTWCAFLTHTERALAVC